MCCLNIFYKLILLLDHPRNVMLSDQSCGIHLRSTWCLVLEPRKKKSMRINSTIPLLFQITWAVRAVLQKQTKNLALNKQCQMSLLCAFICCTLWKMLGFQLVFEGDILGILKKWGKNCKKKGGSRIGETDFKELWLEQFGWHVWMLWRNREINYLTETLRS